MIEKRGLGKDGDEGRRVVYRSRPFEATGFCTGCRSCELACSLENAGVFNPGRSRIRVVTLGTGIDIPVTCQQCEVPWCQAACPAGAIVKEKKGPIVIVDPEKCTGCERCVEACPYGIMMMDSVTGRAIKCNLCNGKPACVAICPSHVLAYAAGEEGSDLNRRRFAALLHGLDAAVRPVPSGKREFVCWPQGNEVKRDETKDVLCGENSPGEPFKRQRS